MSEHDDPDRDDLAAFADDELVGALRAPGSAAELGREQDYLAVYREAGPAPAPIPMTRRSLRRLGTGGTAVVVAVALSGGVAAAYTGNLPAPVQEIAHSVIGAPAPEPPPAEAAPGDGSSRSARPSQSSTPSASPSATPDPSPSSAPSASPSARPSPGKGPASGPGKGAGAGPGPSSPPSDEPTEPPAPALPPTAASIAAASHLASYGGTITFSTQLTDAGGEPIAGHRVLLQVRRTGGWEAVGRSRTDGAGTATATSAPVTGLARYRWRTTGVRSQPWRVKVDADLTAGAAVDATRTTVTGTAVGGNAGDQVLLTTRVNRQVTVVGRARLGADGTVTFSFRTPARKRAFAVVLLKTRDHTAAKARVVVIPPSGRPSEEPSDPPSP